MKQQEKDICLQVCTSCNSSLGTRVDASLLNHPIAKYMRYCLKIRGKNGVPNPFKGMEITYADTPVVGELKVNKEGKINGFRAKHQVIDYNEAGDRYIREAAELLESVVPDNGICARWGGDEFLLIIPECDYGKSKAFVEEIEEKQRIQSESMPYMEIAVGVCVRYDINQPEAEAIQQADQNMYVDKKRKKAEKWK